MIKISDKTKCCGCGACMQICPKNAISMQADNEGFLYPVVDESKCIKCGLCLKSCPILNKPITYKFLGTYAAKHNSNEIKLKSSSGGIFTALSEVIFKDKGVVFGAAFDKNWNVMHTYVEDLKDLDKLRRSKYVQSDIGKTYQKAKEFLELGQKVLFTGTPCQIAGLRNYLNKEYENLITAELFCHGVPSPMVWRKFLEENTKIKNIQSIDFRYKRFGWDASYLNITYKDGSYLPHAPKCLLPLLNLKRGKLFRGFYHLYFSISNLYERPSCYACNFKGIDRVADFTMGDLWGVNKTYPDLYDRMGVSVLLVNTFKAQKIMQRSNLNKEPIDIQKVIQHNPFLVKSVKPHYKRTEFFERCQKEKFNKLIREFLNIKPLAIRIFRKILLNLCLMNCK